MKKILLLFALSLCTLAAWAYDFSAVAPTGQTLYYTITSPNKVSVVNPSPGDIALKGILDYDTWPTGILSIPSSVTNGSTTYSVTSIGYEAFSYCSGLTSVTIPNSVTSIGNSAFSYCSGLADVNIPNSVTSIGNYAFKNVKHITYHGTASGMPWGALSHNGFVEDGFVFSDSTKTILKRYIGSDSIINIPNTVTSISDSAFLNCNTITNVTIPNAVTHIGNYAFYDCQNLTNINIPNSVTSIGSYAFYYCNNLTSIDIPNSVTSIGSYAFYYCRNLSEIISESGTAPSLGYSPFYQVPSSIPVHIPCGSTASYSSSWSYFSNFVEDVPIHVPFTESFDTWSTVLTDPLPNCWEKHTNYSKSYPCASTTYAHTGSKSLHMYSTSSTYSYIVLPQTDIDINQSIKNQFLAISTQLHL